ncbi:MAG TPA: fibrinogen-like YCDxxxxGGGW domain-containing protein [Pseudomonadota bacterium]|nr:fibrinogen-like YCDxxxxGGGW domain-containing protein [Pseudomonadota bacterium]
MNRSRLGIPQLVRGIMLLGIASCGSDPTEMMTPAPSCSDGTKNGTETDVDCGGGACGKCADKKVCVAATDCSGGSCVKGVCAAPSCSDTTKNGSETDVDCGGGTCGKCADSKACVAATDCTSGVCSAKLCAAASCTDTVKNGSETDVDCGGSTCKPCAINLACTTATDCSTSSCKQGLCSYATSCKDLLSGNPALIDGMYMIDPDGAGPIAPLQVLCDMTSDGGGWTLVGKGREGWNWVDQGEGTADELMNNPTGNTVAYLDSTVVAAIVGNPNFMAWNSSLKVHRDSGFNDDYKLRPNAATTFKWSVFSDSRHGCAGPAASTFSGTVNVSASALGLAAFNNNNVDLKDYQNTGNDCTRMFTPLWNSHNCKGGWSTGLSCSPSVAGVTNCFMAGSEGHCIPHVRVWVRD